MPHGSPPDYKNPSLTKDRTFVTKGELRVQLQKHAEIQTRLLKDSLSEMVQMLLMTGVLTEAMLERAVTTAQAAAEAQAETRAEAIGTQSHAIQVDMARHDDAVKAAKPKIEIVH